MNAGTITTDITAVAAGANTILAALEGADPALDVPAETAGLIVTEAASLVTAAISAWSNASGTPITAESVQALLPNPNPLPLPS